MKRAKIMLMAIAVIAIVGGALAFKASKFNQTTFYGCKVINGVSGCFSTFLSAVSIIPGTPTNFHYSTTTVQVGCTPDPLKPATCTVGFKTQVAASE